MLNCKKLAAVMRQAASGGLIWYDDGENVSVLDEAGSFCAVAQMQALLDGKNSIPALMAELNDRPAGTASASNDLWRSLEKITWVKDSGSELCGRDMNV